MAAESEQADESGALPTPDPGDAAGAAEPGAAPPEFAQDDESAEANGSAEVTGSAEEPEEIRPEDVREGVVDLVAYAVGAVALILLGYFTQRDVLTWTRGPFTVVVIIMAVHWAGRRVQARRARSREVPARHDKVEGAR